MATVTPIDDYRPHFMVPTQDGNCHVLPENNIREYIEGKRAFDRIAGTDSELIVRALLRDYLDIVMGCSDG